MERESMVDFIVRNASGNTSERDIRNYYTTVNLGVIESDYQRLLQHEKLKITSKDAETVQASQQAAAAQQAAARAYSDWIWTSICAKPIKHVNPRYNGKRLSPSQACRVEVASWPHDGEKPSQEWFQKIMDEQPFLADRLAWQDYQSPQAEQQHSKENDARTLETFHDLARWGNYSFSQANQTAVLKMFPNGVDNSQLAEAINSGALQLHAASEQEIAENTKALTRAHDIYWSNQSITYIKQNSQLEREQREAIAARTPTSPSRHLGAEPLPPALTAEVIRKADTETIRMWIQRYSRASLNDRLSGVS